MFVNGMFCLVLQRGDDGQSTRLIYPFPGEKQQESIIAVGGDFTFMRIALQPSDLNPNVPSVKYLLSQGRPAPEVEFGIYDVKQKNMETYRAEFSSKDFPVRPGTRGKCLWLCIHKSNLDIAYSQAR